MGFAEADVLEALRATKQDPETAVVYLLAAQERQERRQTPQQEEAREMAAAREAREAAETQAVARERELVQEVGALKERWHEAEARAALAAEQQEADHADLLRRCDRLQASLELGEARCEASENASVLLLARQSSRVLAEHEAAMSSYSAALRRSQQVRDKAPEPAEWPQRLRNSHGPSEPSAF